MKNIAQKDSNYTIGRIIVVDDEAELMSALCEMLAGQGYETAGFLTGAEALAVLKEREFDLLLTDLMMPGMDGIELIRAGLEIDPNLIGIIMTGTRHGADRRGGDEDRRLRLHPETVQAQHPSAAALPRHAGAQSAAGKHAT